MRVAQEVLKAHFLYQITGLDVAVGKKDDAHQHCQQEDMHHVQHPGAAQDFDTGDQKPVALSDFSVGQHCGITGQEHKDLRRITEAEIAHGQFGQRVVRDVIPENKNQRQPAKEIDAVVASVQHHGEYSDKVE